MSLSFFFLFNTTYAKVVTYSIYLLNLSAVVCPKLSVPDKGGVVPALCSQTDVEYGTRCVFYCGDGYALSGPRYTTCQNDTSWSEIAPLSCVRGVYTCFSILAKNLSYLFRYSTKAAARLFVVNQPLNNQFALLCPRSVHGSMDFVSDRQS